MNRILKFRHWHPGFGDKVAYMEEPIDWLPSDRDFGIWMQYTGLKDKNGKDCYEGDIVSFEEPQFETEMLKCPVVFHEGSFCAKWRNGWIPVWDFVDDFEIIGNIYSNPDLLANHQ